MADKVLQAVIRLRDDISRPLRTIRGNLDDLGRNINNNNRRMNNLRTGMKAVGKGAVVAGGAIVASLGTAFVYSAKKAIEFESAFAGVKKTLNTDGMSAGEIKTTLDGLNKGLLKMSNTMPQSASELAAIAESAGQLGIKTPNILEFTKTMAMLGDTTNLTSEEGATTFARFANIVGMSQNDFGRLGSVTVALGNNLATTEQEISAMALRLAGAGSQVGMTEAQIFSLSGALSSVGIEAEAGGTAFSKVISSMQLSVETGKGNLKGFAKVAGMTTQEFSKRFKSDATGALMEFIKGLDNTKRNGKSATAVLSDMGIEEVRLTDALKRASGASGVFEKALTIGNKAWKENNALVNEAKQRYGTTESSLKMMRNQIDNASITIGNAFLPVIRDATQFLGGIAEKFNNLDPNVKKVIITVGLITLGIGLLLLIGGGLLIFVANVSGAFLALGGVAGILGGILSIVSGAITFMGFVLGLLLNPFVLVTAVVGLFALAYKNNFFGIRDITNKVCGWVKEQLHKVGDKLSWLTDAVKGLANWWTKMRDKIEKNPIVATVKKVFGDSGDTGKAAMSGNLKPKKRKAFGGTISKNDTLARLHQGERVLTKQESNRYDKGNQGRDVTINVNGMTIREEADINKFAKQLVRELNNQKIVVVGGV